jgi:hypothetical protein
MRYPFRRDMFVRHRRLLTTCLVVALGALVWFLLSRPPSASAWCALESHRYATVGEPLQIRVTLRQPLSANDVHVDLHWATVRREPRGFLVEATLTPSNVRAATLDATMRLPAQEDLGYVHAVVFVSPTGKWTDRTWTATSEPIAVHQASSAPVTTSLYPLFVMDEKGPEPVVVHDSPVVRICISVLWLTSVMALRRVRREPGATSVMVACFLAAIWELVPVERALSGIVRSWTLEHRLYYERQAFQTVATTIVITAAAGLLALTIFGAHRRVWRNASVGLMIYAGIAITSSISLHAVDAVLATTVAGLSANETVRLGAAFVTLVATVQIRPPAQGAGQEGRD